MLKFIEINKKLAKKYGAKVSIGYAGKEVVLADERKEF